MPISNLSRVVWDVKTEFTNTRKSEDLRRPVAMEVDDDEETATESLDGPGPGGGHLGDQATSRGHAGRGSWDRNRSQLPGQVSDEEEDSGTEDDENMRVKQQVRVCRSMRAC